MSPKNKFHQEILRKIKAVSKLSTPDNEGFGLKYVGTNKKSYHLNSKDTQGVIKEFIKENKLNTQQLHDLLDSLYDSDTFEEIVIAAKIIEYSSELKKEIDFNKLNSWLGKVHGWAEVDVLCQMAFSPEDVLPRWTEWKEFIEKINKDENVHRRRASLVLLTKLVRLSDDSRLSELAFKNTDNLKHEKDILITKAVSWILRSLIKNHKDEVSEYLKNNLDSLPKIAIREVKSKLETGKKYINHKKNGLAKT